ncbi:hypothetical protein RUM44_009165 [Polyplax serrata]|uniref:Uncharacterized protein n=1 Tax=Polyplax serrata TaxID=468196 RepID=A0ABR1ARX3_POLSC
MKRPSRREEKPNLIRWKACSERGGRYKPSCSTTREGSLGLSNDRKECTWKGGRKPFGLPLLGTTAGIQEEGNLAVADGQRVKCGLQTRVPQGTRKGNRFNEPVRVGSLSGNIKPRGAHLYPESRLEPSSERHPFISVSSLLFLVFFEGTSARGVSELERRKRRDPAEGDFFGC